MLSQDNQLEEALALCNNNPYGLTGAIFAQDEAAIDYMTRRLRHAAGNFYVNDKPTGAVVGQQPFGGSRASGSNNNAGSKEGLHVYTSVQSGKRFYGRQVFPPSYMVT